MFQIFRNFKAFDRQEEKQTQYVTFSYFCSVQFKNGLLNTFFKWYNNMLDLLCIMGNQYGEKFRDIIVRMGAFHTACTSFGIIGKGLQDAGLRDQCVESQVIAEGSVSGLLEERKYKRSVRCGLDSKSG